MASDSSDATRELAQVDLYDNLRAAFGFGGDTRLTIGFGEIIADLFYSITGLPPQKHNQLSSRLDKLRR